MEYSRAQIIDHYFLQIESGEMSFSEMRPNLKEMDVEIDEINIIVKQVDQQLQSTALKNSREKLGKNIFYSGLLLTSIGMVIIAATLLNLIKGGLMIYYGAIVVGGLSLAMMGRRKMKGGT